MAGQGSSPPQQAVEPQQDDVNTSLRASIDDCIEIVGKMAPLCGSIDEMLQMLELGLKNDSQLEMLKMIFTPKRLRSR